MCVYDSDGFRYVGVDVNLGRVMAAGGSLRRLLMLILVDLVLPIFLDIFRIAFCFLIVKLSYNKYIKIKSINGR